MTQAANDNIISAFRVSDLITLEGEPRVQDLLLGERLGMALPLNLRAKIKANHSELSLHGELRTETVPTSAKGGRPGVAYYLNEAQALLLCMFANTKIAAQVRKMLIDVFMEFRRGKLPVVTDYAMPLAEAREAVEASLARMERAVADIHAASKPQHLSAMVVNGEPVIVDANDYMMEGDDEAVILKWDGSLEITKPINVVLGENSFQRDDITREVGRKSYSRFQQHGDRSGFTPFRQQGRMRVRDGCVILGKVIRAKNGGGQIYAEHEPVIEPVAIAAPSRKRRKPMNYATQQRVLQLFRENGLQLWEIAELVNYPYHMVQRVTCAAEKSRKKYTLRAVG